MNLDRADKQTRAKWFASWQRHTRLAQTLRCNGAPTILIASETQRAHEAKLRAWGWIGPINYTATPEGRF